MKNIIFFLMFSVGFFHCKFLYSLKTDQQPFHLSEPITSDDILFRYYCINRLKGAVDCLSKLSVYKTLPCKFTYQLQDHKLYLGNKIFFHKCVMDAIVDMNERKTIRPFLCLWERLCHYRYLEDSIVVTEFTNLLVYLLSFTLKNKFPEKYTRNKNLAVLDALEDMDLVDILDVLDTLVEEIPELFEKYDLDSDKSWYEWGKKYCIPATLSIIILGIKMYMLYENYHSQSEGGEQELTVIDVMQEG